MLLDQFDYELPEALIAQEALPDRGASRLLVVPGAGDPIDSHFHNLPDFLEEGDLLVVNRSRVVPARLYLRRATGGSVEALFIESRADGAFDAWVRPMRRIRPGERLRAEDGETVFEFIEAVDERTGRLRLEGSAPLDEVLGRIGHVPLPPYIHRADRESDRERYQTVFADRDGSVAAPTAGLHFDDGLLERVRTRGAEVCPVTLHVGPGTFAPLEHEKVEANTLHAEHVALDEAAVSAITAARRDGRRVIAVGTTVARTLEFAASQGWLDAPARDRSGSTNLFIYPGYKFGAVDALITNFHLPRSSLLLLVCAFGGRERILRCYAEAVARRYRFYSYGDAMFVREPMLDSAPGRGVT